MTEPLATTTKAGDALPSAEVGYVNPEGLNWAQWDADEKIPDLQHPNSVRVYYRMPREDGRVASLLQAIGLPVRRTPWRIDPNGARDEVVEFCSHDLGLPIVGAEPDDVDGNGNPVLASPSRRNRDRFSWAQHLQQALLMLQYGHSFFEQVYRVTGEGAEKRYRLRKLAPRPQRTISKIRVARDGGLHSIVQNPPAFDGTTLYPPTEIEVPVHKLVAYVRDPEPGQWVGSSLLRPAYKHWILKDETLRNQAAGIRRNSMGVPVVTCAKDDPEQVKRAQEIASSFRAGNHAGVGLPPNWNLELKGVSGNLPDPQKAIEYNDRQIALAGLAHFLNLDRGGSYALASVQADTFVQSVQTVAESICETANFHVVWDLVDLNFGEDEPAPKIVFDEIGTRQDATAAALKMLVEAGLLSPDVLVERKIRQDLGLPSPDGDDMSDVAPTATPSATPTPVAAQRGRRLRAHPNQGELF
ncbi:portal protein [Gordonia phage MagicMan]|uniref:Portal protein n=1 Tax=Gordonia phage Schnabeltier TaxID=1821561 RepID=A0A142K9Z1_9CAUD|nr:portal protein [Gordonia phage Schnabeltier]AMS02924.1 portal protein [Gordonia phage Schnabeltier]QDM55820.1 portal protein [Gordonia phage MagicMan]